MPTTISFFARGDGSSANNAALNIENKSTQPVVQLTFQASPGGDIVLEYNGGANDPDTTVTINGVTYNFKVELTGVLPTSGKVPDILEGKTITVVSVVINGTTERFFFVNDGTGSSSLMGQFGNGAVALTSANFAPPPVHVCYCAGTGILTPNGYREIGALARGDLVMTAEGVAKPIRWIGRTDISAQEMRNNPDLCPVRIKANSIYPGVPFSDLDVSAQHRIVVHDPVTDLLFSEDRVMIRAKHLVGSIAKVLMPQSGVSYFHLLLDDHDMVIANGLESESFQPSHDNYIGLPSAMKQTFTANVSTTKLHALFRRPDKMNTLKSHEADVYVACKPTNRSLRAPAMLHGEMNEISIAA